MLYRLLYLAHLRSIAFLLSNQDLPNIVCDIILFKLLIPSITEVFDTLNSTNRLWLYLKFTCYLRHTPIICPLGEVMPFGVVCNVVFKRTTRNCRLILLFNRTSVHLVRSCNHFPFCVGKCTLLSRNQGTYKSKNWNVKRNVSWYHFISDESDHYKNGLWGSWKILTSYYVLKFYFTDFSGV